MPSLLQDYRRGTGRLQRVWNEIEKKLYNLARVVRAYKDPEHIRQIEEALQLVSQSKRLYPSPQMLNIRGVRGAVPSKPFDANLLMNLVLTRANNIYNKYHPLYLALVSQNTNSANFMNFRNVQVRDSRNIQHERFQRKRATRASYESQRRKRSPPSFPLGMLPTGIARQVASKLGNADLVSFMRSSKGTKTEATGLLKERLKPYNDFVSSLLSDMQHLIANHRQIKDLPVGSSVAGGYTVDVANPRAPTVAKFTKKPVHAYVELTVSPREASALVYSQNSNSVYRLTAKPARSGGDGGNTFRTLRGPETSEFLKRSWEAARRLGFQKYQPQKYQPQNLLLNAANAAFNSDTE